jgi:ribosomal protein S18 acetylase RimI-like enzyme
MRELERIISSPATQLLVAVDTEAVDMGRGRDDNRADSVSGTTAIVGMLTLIVCQIPTGTRAWIEDVVVDVKARRFGIATSLVQMALRLAQEAGAVTVELTSRPSRKAANLLYESIGFERRDTNVYRYRFEQALNIGHDESM